MIVALTTLALAETPVGSPYALLGNRLEADGLGSSVAIQESIVVGSDGGVLATQVAARLSRPDWSVAVHVPFASYRTADGRTTGFGNLRLEGFRRVESNGIQRLMGVELHLPTGQAYTWANDTQSHWPGGGLTAVFQERRPLGEFDLLWRGALGLHGTNGVAPYPAFYLHASAAAGLDADLPIDGLGVLGEAAITVWDPSPFDLAGWLRWEPTTGLRLRSGVLFPVGAWVGLSPGDKPAGLREGTLQLDLAMAL